MKNSYLLMIVDWDEKLGPKVIDLHSKASNIGDPEIIAINTFMTYQNLYSSGSNTKFERTFLAMPLKSQKHISRVMFDVADDEEVRGGLRPFFCGIFIPDRFLEKEIVQFDPILEKVSARYKESSSDIDLEEFDEEISNKMELLSAQKEVQVVLDSSYSLTNAIEDFKKGVLQFKEKNWESAYTLIKKSMMKFEEENQIKLHMESTYLLATILTQLRKYEAAIDYFKSLHKLAKKMEYNKYIELSQFMKGFVNYKLRNYLETKEIFSKIEIDGSKFINKLQFYSLCGKINKKLELFEIAIDYYNKALEHSFTMDESKGLKKQRGQVLFELGLVHYQFAISKLKKKGITSESAMKNIKPFMNHSIDYFKSAVKVLETLHDFRKTGKIYQIIANIYGFLQETEKQANSMMQALEMNRKIDNLSQQIEITNEIIRLMETQEKYQKIIKIIQSTLQNLKQQAFVDSYTLAIFHFKMAKAYHKLEEYDDAVMELVGAIKTFKKLDINIPEHQDSLRLLIDIYGKKGNEDKKNYYEYELSKLEKKKEKGKRKKNQLGLVKDLWFFTDSGIEIFSYAPEVKFNPTLLGGFLTAMQNFSMEISKERLGAIEIGNSKYFFYRENNRNFYLLARSNLKVAESSVRKILGEIYKKFFNKYAESLANFSGECSKFLSFEENLKQMDFSLY